MRFKLQLSIFIKPWTVRKCSLDMCRHVFSDGHCPKWSSKETCLSDSPGLCISMYWQS